MNKPTVHHGDCIEVMRTMEAESVDSIVTDPPYELSNDSKSSANRVFAEMMLPKDSHLKALGLSESVLPLFVDKILELCGSGVIPSPTPTVPVGAVAFDDYSTCRDNNVVDGVESSVGITGDAARVNVETEVPVHLGSFALKLTDPSKLIEVVGKLGACFDSGRLGVGLGVSTPSLPSLETSSPPVVGTDHGVWSRDGALADLVRAFTGASVDTMFSFDLRRGAVESFTADGARVFASILLESGADLVRASAATASLPSVLESRRVCVVDDSARGAFTFDLIVHTQSISSVGFMGKAWDGSKVAYDVAVWRECLRVLKPGGFILAFGGSRTWHRLAVAIEDGGFEIRDSVAWIFGSGFPKHRASLKPAFEPIVMGRKPYKGSLVANEALHGTGALNIDGCRIGTEAVSTHSRGENTAFPKVPGAKTPEDYGRKVDQTPQNVGVERSGRWPANVILDEHTAELLDEQSGISAPKAERTGKIGGQSSKSGIYSPGDPQTLGTWPGDNGGGASRFFYCAKASKRERPNVDGTVHTTVKPLTLMRHLIRLVTPEGGTVLDTFAGSGTTLEAAMLEGFDSIGIENEAEYLPLIQYRIYRAEEQ